MITQPASSQSELTRMATQYQRKPFQSVLGKLTNPQQFKKTRILR